MSGPGKSLVKSDEEKCRGISDAFAIATDQDWVALKCGAIDYTTGLQGKIPAKLLTDAPPKVPDSPSWVKMDWCGNESLLFESTRLAHCCLARSLPVQGNRRRYRVIVSLNLGKAFAEVGNSNRQVLCGRVVGKTTSKPMDEGDREVGGCA